MLWRLILDLPQLPRACKPLHVRVAAFGHRNHDSHVRVGLSQGLLQGVRFTLRLILHGRSHLMLEGVGALRIRFVLVLRTYATSCGVWSGPICPSVFLQYFQSLKSQVKHKREPKKI